MKKLFSISLILGLLLSALSPEVTFARAAVVVADTAVVVADTAAVVEDTGGGGGHGGGGGGHSGGVADTAVVELEWRRSK